MNFVKTIEFLKFEGSYW